jgi:hypothetical protein
LDRDRTLRAAAELDTASEARFQSALPFEPVNRPRLERLRAERTVARSAPPTSAAGFLARQRRAQIAARHAIERLNPWNSSKSNVVNLPNRVSFTSALHAAELQLPESWLPFVIGQ